MIVLGIVGGLVFLLVAIALWGGRRSRQYRDVYSGRPASYQSVPFLFRLFDGTTEAPGPL